MFTVYVLKSRRNGRRYIGYTGKLAETRVKEHNEGSNTFTRHNGPYVLIHTELFENKTEAIKREKFLKSGKGREWLDHNLRA